MHSSRKDLNLSALIEQVRENDRDLRAWAHLATATAADVATMGAAAADKPHSGPLAGVPFGVKDVIDVAKTDPSKVAYASAGPGSSAHLGSELLKSVAKVGMLHVPYKGGAPAIIDLTAGRVQFMLLDPPQAMPQIKSERLRAIVVGSASRLPLLPDVPSASDAGYPGFEATVWWGFAVPKGTPPEIIAKLNKEINTAVNSPDVQKVLSDMGVITKPETPEQFGAFINEQAAKWSTIIKGANITAE